MRIILSLGNMKVDQINLCYMDLNTSSGDLRAQKVRNEANKDFSLIETQFNVLHC
jgi:hypothetical protein